MLLSQEGNPYYGVGPAIKGIGGQHIDEMHPWPMGIVSEVITGLDDKVSIGLSASLDRLITFFRGVGHIGED